MMTKLVNLARKNKLFEIVIKALLYCRSRQWKVTESLSG